MALSSLRDLFGQDSDQVLVTDRSTVRVANVSIDVSEFEQGASSEDLSVLESALRKVKGPLLAGFDDSWIVAQWLRLEESYAQAAVRLMELALHGDVKGGIRFGKEAVALLGPREDVHLALMKLFVADGQPALAVAQFEELERSLEDQWGESPTQSAYAVLDSLPKGGRSARPSLAKPSVPARVSSFFGREQEVAQVLDLILGSNNRLTTLTGVGGCGKTSLAREVARHLSEKSDKWVCLVELADLQVASRIVGRIFQAVEGESDATVTIDSLRKSLGARDSLLVLDNLEQLLPEGGLVVKSVLESIPECRVMATSRRPLDVEGEQVYQVPPLGLPDVSMSLAALAQVPSVALFADRAKASKGDFVLGPSNASAVAEICRKLEGLPLAIELAAAKVLANSPAQILAKLSGSHDFLVSKRHDVPERQRSLTATLDWSLALLDAGAAALYPSLGVFRGSFSLAGAESVTGGRDCSEALESLIKASLVTSVPSPAEPRFRLLEPIREHALSKLSLNDLKRARQRHFDFALQIVRGEDMPNPGPANKDWLDLLDREHENLCAAFECALDETVEAPRAVELALAARPFFRPRGKSAVWRSLLAQLKLKLASSEDVQTKAKLWLAHAQMCANVVDYETLRQHHTEAQALCEAAGDLDGLGHAYAGLAGTYKVAGDYPGSIDYYEKAVEAFQATKNAKQLAMTIRQMAMSYVSMHDHEKTYEKLKEALPYAREDGDPDTLAWTLTDVGVEHALHGFSEESEACFAEAHSICTKTDNSHMRSIVFWQEAETRLRMGDPRASVELHFLSVEHALRAEFREGLKWILLSYGCALAQAGQAHDGVVVAKFTEAWRERENRPLTGDEYEILNPAMAAAREALGDALFDDLATTGKSAQLDDVLSIVGHGKVPGVPTKSV